MILKLTLYKQYFDEILSGQKKEEYRLVKPFWEKKLTKRYDGIQFTNGYGNDRPMMIVECLGIERNKVVVDLFNDSVEVFVIKLGRILETKNISEMNKYVRHVEGK